MGDGGKSKLWREPSPDSAEATLPWNGPRLVAHTATPQRDLSQTSSFSYFSFFATSPSASQAQNMVKLWPPLSSVFCVQLDTKSYQSSFQRPFSKKSSCTPYCFNLPDSHSCPSWQKPNFVQSDNKIPADSFLPYSPWQLGGVTEIYTWDGSRRFLGKICSP